MNKRVIALKKSVKFRVPFTEYQDMVRLEHG